MDARAAHGAIKSAGRVHNHATGEVDPYVDLASFANTRTTMRAGGSKTPDSPGKTTGALTGSSVPCSIRRRQFLRRHSL